MVNGLRYWIVLKYFLKSIIPIGYSLDTPYNHASQTRSGQNRTPSCHPLWSSEIAYFTDSMPWWCWSWWGSYWRLYTCCGKEANRNDTRTPASFGLPASNKHSSSSFQRLREEINNKNCRNRKQLVLPLYQHRQTNEHLVSNSPIRRHTKRATSASFS